MKEHKNLHSYRPAYDNPISTVSYPVVTQAKQLVVEFPSLLESRNRFNVSIEVSPEKLAMIQAQQDRKRVNKKFKSMIEIYDQNKRKKLSQKTQ